LKTISAAAIPTLKRIFRLSRKSTASLQASKSVSK
jgi:hypothetical protein